MKTNETQEMTETAQRAPEDLWLDESIDPVELIRLDPCHEVTDLLKLAGSVTPVDEFVASLPDPDWSMRLEELWLRTIKPRGGTETPEAFAKRVRG